MKLQKRKLGFTLIELLVVITIIGILATGAVSVYTSQIQKARDSTRLTDVWAVKAWVEQVYQDYSEYPVSNDTSTTWVKFSMVLTYTPKIPEDPKSGQKRAWSAFDYIYTVWDDSNDIINQDFEVSTSFENQWNIANKAEWDGWDDDVRLELWIDLTWNDTQVTDIIDPNYLLYSCVDVNGGTVTCDDTGSKMLIRKQ